MGIAQVTNNYRMRHYVDIKSLALDFLEAKYVYITFGKGTFYKFFSSYPNTSSVDKLYISANKNAVFFHS